MGTNLMRALLLTSASVAMVATAAPTAAYAQEATYQIDIPAQSMGDALRALGKATKQNIVFSGSVVKGKRSAAVRGRMSAGEALDRMLQGSGLKMSRGSGGGLVVMGGNVSTAPVRDDPPAIAAGSIAAPSATASTVADARTGAALKGALVEIVETGEKTSTGDLGEFRFPGKTGSFNLRISYLGYPQYEQFVDLHDGRATTSILLSDGSAAGEIVVTAYQSARAQALNQERSAENTSTVVSSDLLGQFDGSTISDALRRSPGIAFQVDDITGDGTNVIVRGLPSSFNTINLNGVRLPVGDGTSRAPNLGNILAESISKITINKTLLPSQDGTGTGALIEIETKTPLDRPARYFSFTADKAGSEKSFLNEFSASGVASLRFGADKNFGLSASVEYRRRNIRSVQLNSEPQYPRYLPATADGRTVRSILDIDPRTTFPFEESVSEILQGNLGAFAYDAEVRNLAITVSSEWNISDHTNLKLTFNRSRSKTESFGRGINIQELRTFARLPIDELNGESRLAYVWENARGAGTGLRANVNQSATYSPGNTNTVSTLSFQGKSELGSLELNYSAGWANGEERTPDTTSVTFTPSTSFLQLDRSHLTDQVLGQTVAGRMISLFPYRNGPGIGGPGLNATGFALLNDPGAFNVRTVSQSTGSGENDRLTGSASAKYNFTQSLINYIEAGVFYDRSRSINSTDDFRFYTIPSQSMAAQGLSFSEDSLSDIGFSDNLKFVSRSNFLRFYDNLISGGIPGTTVDIPTFDTINGFMGTEERTLAGYLQASLTLGRLDIIGGARLESVRTTGGGTRESYIFLEDGSIDEQYLAANPPVYEQYTGTDTRVLPRVQANFRFNPNLILRAGYYQTISRPELGQLRGTASFALNLAPFFGQNGDQPQLDILLPNPGLKAAVTGNFDLSLEWYAKSIGVIKLGVFYKPTKNPFFSNVQGSLDAVPDGIVLPDDPRFSQPDLNIVVSQPGNSGCTAKHWGIEVSVERKFDFLPGVLGGFGIFANYTYANGKREVTDFYQFAPGGVITAIKPFPTQPRHSGTAALTYSKENLDASLSYTKQDRYMVSYGKFGFDNYKDAYSSLDLKISYRTTLRQTPISLFFEGSNLLRGTGDANTSSSAGGIGTVPKATRNQSYLGGATFRGGFNVTF